MPSGQARLLVHVEGETEERFTNSVLRPYLCERGYCSVDARLLGNARLRSGRGGIKPWDAVRRDILRHLAQDRGCLNTTLVDYYGMPSAGQGAWPGRDAVVLGVEAKAQAVELGMLKSVAAVSEELAIRFVPNVVMHEFEGLLFSGCREFAAAAGVPELGPEFEAIRNTFPTPEDINDSPVTAPSKRVAALVPGYQKPLQGSIAAERLGLELIGRECPHFKMWLDALEMRAQGG